MNVILQKIETYLLENEREGQRYTARGSWECSVRLGSRVLCRRSRVKCRSSRVQRRRLQHLLFIFCITYLFLKIFFSFDPRPGFRKPQGFFWCSVLLPFDHSRHLNPEYPAPLGVRHYVKFQERIKVKLWLAKKVKKKSAKLNISHENKTVLK